MNLSELVSVGSLDSCGGNTLRGWFRSDAENALENIRLLVDGEIHEIEPTIEDRPDVVEIHGGKLSCGFLFDLSDIDFLPVSEIGVLHTDSKYNFNGRLFKYYSIKEEYSDVLKALVMPEYYRSRYTLSELSDDEIINHYISKGIYKNYDPNPWFDSQYYIKRYQKYLDETGIAITSYLVNEHLLEVNPSQQFNTSYYFHAYPDIGKSSGIFLHYVVNGQKERRQMCDYDPPSSVFDQARCIADLEPQCEKFLDKKHRVIRYPQIRSSTYLPMSVLQKCPDNIEVVITVPFISVGGADLISTFVLKALQERYSESNILLIVTDHDGIEVPEWVSSQSNVLVLQKYAKYKNSQEKIQSLHTIIGLLSPSKVININSPTAWKLITQYGKQLSTVVDIYAYLFCFDYSQSNKKVGYITEHIRDSIQYLTKVFCDNKKIILDIQNLYRFPSDLMKKFATVYVPFPDSIGSQWTKPVEQNQKKILWTGRLSKQKGPEYLVEVSKILRDFEFHVYGPPGDSPESNYIVEGYYPNIIYKGVYSHLEEVTVSNYECYLSTSQWEGLPTVLIQMMARGIPIVTSVVGGVEELANHNSAWLVKNSELPMSYVNSIRLMLVNSEETLGKVALAKSRVMEKHVWSAFISNLEQLGFVPSATINEGEDTQDIIEQVA